MPHAAQRIPFIDGHPVPVRRLRRGRRAGAALAARLGAVEGDARHVAVFLGNLRGPGTRPPHRGRPVDGLRAGMHDRVATARRRQLPLRVQLPRRHAGGRLQGRPGQGLYLARRHHDGIERQDAGAAHGTGGRIPRRLPGRTGAGREENARRHGDEKSVRQSRGRTARARRRAACQSCRTANCRGRAAWRSGARPWRRLCYTAAVPTSPRVPCPPSPSSRP